MKPVPVKPNGYMIPAKNKAFAACSVFLHQKLCIFERLWSFLKIRNNTQGAVQLMPPLVKTSSIICCEIEKAEISIPRFFKKRYLLTYGGQGLYAYIRSFSIISSAECRMLFINPVQFHLVGCFHLLRHALRRRHPVWLSVPASRSLSARFSVRCSFSLPDVSRFTNRILRCCFRYFFRSNAYLPQTILAASGDSSVRSGWGCGSRPPFRICQFHIQNSFHAVLRLYQYYGVFFS